MLSYSMTPNFDWVNSSGVNYNGNVYYLDVNHRILVFDPRSKTLTHITELN